MELTNIGISPGIMEILTMSEWIVLGILLRCSRPPMIRDTMDTAIGDIDVVLVSCIEASMGFISRIVRLSCPITYHIGGRSLCPSHIARSILSPLGGQLWKSRDPKSIADIPSSSDHTLLTYNSCALGKFGCS